MGAFGCLGELWEALNRLGKGLWGAFGSLWMPLGSSGSPWKLLGALGAARSLWAPSGRLWEPWALGRLWDPAAIVLKEKNLRFSLPGPAEALRLGLGRRGWAGEELKLGP